MDTTEVLRESAIKNGCVPPDIIWNNFMRDGNKAWEQTTVEERGWVKMYASNKLVEAKKGNEYAYYFWNRVLKRIIQGLPPVGVEK